MVSSALAWFAEVVVDPGGGRAQGEFEVRGDRHLGDRVAVFVHGAEHREGLVFVGNDVQLDREGGLRCGHLDALMQLRVQLLLVPADHLGCRLDQGTEGGGIQRLGVLFVPAHRPRSYERRLGFALEGHLDGPAVVVLVLDDACGPAVVAPQARLVDAVVRSVFAIVLEGECVFVYAHSGCSVLRCQPSGLDTGYLSTIIAGCACTVW